MKAQNKTDYNEEAQNLVQQMTLEEKAMLLTGDGWWKTHAIERLNIPSVFMTDGPHGLRKEAGSGLSQSIPATCFPTASAVASSWNTDLIREEGIALAAECQANDVQILLGPGTNMKRSPLGGRNFEYFAEDPVLAGKMAASYINGVQSGGVGTSLKHFAVNNQEYQRMSSSSNLDERTFHELYLPAFEIAIKEAQPWSVMCSYNLINEVYASENRLLLQDILRDEFGFKGFVVSDWGAVNNRVAGVFAGNNLEMPGSGDYNSNKIIAAVKAGILSQARLDEMVSQLLAVILKANKEHITGSTFDKVKHHELARKIAGESIVLLKNENNILPLNTNIAANISIIGAFAKTPRYQGAGSSQVNPTQLSNVFDELSKLKGKSTLTYSEGYDADGTVSDKQFADALKVAKASNLSIIIAGLPGSYESEGFDRSSISLPEGHNRLIEEIAKVQSNVVVVLMNGSAVSMPWAPKVKAIVEGWLTGQAGGGAIADVLTGKVNPSGKLSETFPYKLEDTPTSIEFPGKNREANYIEGLFIGYRYNDKKKITPLFPFGFGLSYTTFFYRDLKLSTGSITGKYNLNVELKVANIGNVAGKEVVELYVHEQNPFETRPENELKAFAKIDLQPGEEKTISFQLSPRDFSWYDASMHQWRINAGKFDVLVGPSSRDLPLKQTVEIAQIEKGFEPVTRYSTVREALANPAGKDYINVILAGFGMKTIGTSDGKAGWTDEQVAEREKAEKEMVDFIADMPLNKIPAMTQGKFTDQMLMDLIKMCNGE